MTERDVAVRAFCLAALCALAAAADDLRRGEADEADVREFEDGVRQWIDDEGLDAHFTPAERETMSKPLTAWTERELIDASWRQESLVVLLWALSLVDDLLAYDEQVEDAPETAPLFDPLDAFLAGAVLRPRAELEREQERAKLWHWRARTRRLETDPDHEPVRSEHDLVAIVAEVAPQAHAAGDIPDPIDGDFPAFGKAYRDLDEEEFDLATSLALERHYALNWLCGLAEAWDDVPTDT